MKKMFRRIFDKEIKGFSPNDRLEAIKSDSYYSFNDLNGFNR